MPQQPPQALLFSQQYAKLNLFLSEEGFSRSNLDRVNYYNVTPLTLAIESKKPRYVKELLELGANPSIENCHGNTPLHLSAHEPEMLEMIKNAIKKIRCSQLKCAEGEVFTQNGDKYKVTRIIRGGSSSIKVFEIEDLKSGEHHILKVKYSFNGLELRNYMLLNKYEDFFPIKYFMLDDLVFHDVFALKQKVVPGLKLSAAINKETDQVAKDQIIYQAIIALCRLHERGFVHRDALPDNCHWDPEAKRAEFLDFDILRTKYDFSSTQFAGTVIYDFRRLLLGCFTRGDSRIKGLSYYTPNITQIINNIPDKILDPKLKSKIHAELLKVLGSPAHSNRRGRSRVVAKR